MDAGNSVAASYLANPTGRNVHGHGPSHTNADPSTAMMNQFAGLSLGQMNMSGNSAPVPMGPGHTFMVGSDGQFLLAPMHSSQPMGMTHSNDNHYHGFGMPAANGYGNPYVGLQMPMMPYTPGRPVAHPRVERGQSEVPGLENRRGSYSTTESTPATPFYGAVAQRDGGPRVASLDRSAYTTPSPQQFGVTSLHSDAAKAASNVAPDVNIDDILKIDPPVPRAVPAVFTPPSQMKGVDQSLENRIPGNRNVYIRGLHPTTDDELLFKFASRFGPVETSKAIIDTATGACKG